ncbi:MAG: hypothetical protein KAU14_03000, partial [Thermoplasmata archaeon]|nr:hypothetical protein [Thermoplasmata archaeon]
TNSGIYCGEGEEGGVCDKVYVVGANHNAYFGYTSHLWGDIYTGGGGLSVFDFDDDTWTSRTWGPPVNDFNKMAVDEKEIWGIGDSSILRYDRVEETWDLWTTLPGLYGNYFYIYSIAMDADRVYVGLENQMAIFDRQARQWEMINASSDGLPCGSIESILLVDDMVILGLTRVWNSSRGKFVGGGVAIYYSGNDTLELFNTTTGDLASDYVYFLNADANEIWIGYAWDAGAASVFYFENHTWQTFTTSDSGLRGNVYGLALSTGWVYFRHSDPDEISAYNRTTGEWRVYNFSNGIYGNESGWEIADIYAHNNILYVATKTKWSEYPGCEISVLDIDSGVWGILNLSSEHTFQSHASEKINRILVNKEGIWLTTDCKCIDHFTREQELILWQAADIIDVNETAVFHRFVDFLNETGKYGIRVTLRTGRGQVLAIAGAVFELVNRSTLLNMSVPKEFYKPGEGIEVSGWIANLADIGGDFNLTVWDGPDMVYSQNLTIDSMETRFYSFNFSTMNSTKLEARVQGANASLHIRIKKPKLNVTLNVPAIVGHKSFNATLTIENTGLVNVSLNIDFMGAIHQMDIDPNGMSRINQTFTTLEDMNITANITGDVVYGIWREVTFGDAASLIVDTSVLLPEGGADIPFTVYNTGALDLKLGITFSVNPMENVTVFVPRGKNTTATIFFNLTAGAYTMTYSSALFDGQVDINITPKLRLEWNNTMVKHLNDTLELISNITNLGAEDFTGTLGFSLPFGEVLSPINIGIGSTRTFRLYLNIGNATPDTYNTTISVIRD